MKRTLLAAVGLAGATLCSIASAQGYVGVGVGQARLDVDCSGTSSCDKSDTALKLYGGYMFTPNFGVEGAWLDHGKAKATVDGDRVELESDGLGVWAIGVAPMNQWSLFAKLGIVSSKTKGRVVGVGSESDRNTIAAWGVGAGYDFTKNVGLRFEYEGMRLKWEGLKEDLGVFTLGLQYKF